MNLAKELLLADSYSRMGVLLRRFGTMPRADWFKAAGSAWSICDNIGQHREQLRAILAEATRADLDAMLSPYAKRRLRSLPESLTIFRGCYESNRDGLSWSLRRDIAARFPTLNRYRQKGAPLLLVGEVPKRTAVLITDRKEAEVIAPAVRVIEAIPL